MIDYENSTKKQCYHCGNQVFMKTINELKNDVVEDVGNDQFHHYVCFYERWHIEQCTICDKVTITKEEWNSEEEQFFQELGELLWKNHEIIYPRISFEDKHNIPKDIWSAFESALKVQRIDGTVCMMALRRTLEVMCKDKGETTGSLQRKLENLANRKIIPPVIDGIASLLRQKGNAAAHGDNVEFPEYVVKEMSDYTRIILDYVYVLPAKLKKSQQRIDKKNKKMEEIEI